MDESKKSAVESPPADMLLVLPIGVSADFIESKLSDLPDLPVERVHVDEECRHRYGSIVDGDRRTVTCKRCNGPVDPVTALVWIATEFQRHKDRWNRYRNEAQQIALEIQTLKAEKKKLAGAGASFRKKDCTKGLAKQDGHRMRWHVRDAGSDGDRLDYYYARFRDLSDALIGSGQAVHLGDLIEPRTLADRRPDSSPTSEYDCAVVQRVGVVSPKGIEVLKYSAENLWIVRDGDITISGIDLVYRAAAVAGPEVDGLVMSKEMFAYRVKDGVDVLPEYIVVMLRTDPVNAMLLGRVSGTSGRLRVNDPREILDIPVLKPPGIKDQEEVVKVAREAAYHRKQATESLAKAAQMIVAKWPV